MPTSRTKPTTPEPEAAAPRWASPRSTAAYLNVSARTITYKIASGEIPAYRFGPKLVRINLNEVDALMQPITNGGSA
jgi:excisionase family DNA binding protein